MSTPRTVPPRSRWRRRFCLLGALLVLAGVIWWLTRPDYRLVGEFATVDGLVVACARGFLTHQGGGNYTLYDWQGRPRWRVSVPHSPLYNPAGISVAEPGGPYYAISPDGRYFAHPLSGRGGTRIRLWREGRPVADLPFDHLCEALVVLDSGRVIACDQFTTVTAYQDGRVLARGRVIPRPAPRRISIPYDTHVTLTTLYHPNPAYHCRLAPDGAMVAVKTRYDAWDCYDVRTTGQAITATKQYAADSHRDFTLYAGGSALTAGGDEYQRGRGTPIATGWWGTPRPAGGRYALQYAQKTYGLARVYAPGTGAAWNCRVNGRVVDGAASAHGRFGVVQYFPTVHVTEAALRRYFLFTGGIRALPRLALFARPGRRIATLSGRQFAHKLRDRFARVGYASLSPDGRALVLTFAIGDGWDGQCLLFRR